VHLIGSRDVRTNQPIDGSTTVPQTYGPFFYIAFLSTKPEHQGKGLGGQLLQHLVSKADAAGKWCYLEATNERNARLYER
jgi:ribosomal protein S18 acetylase RimI-like enzyme